MNIAQLVRMANQIGAFFATMPDHEKSLTGIAEHLRKFWEPRMRSELLAFVQNHPDGCSGEISLTPLVLQAIVSHRADLAPKSRS